MNKSDSKPRGLRTPRQRFQDAWAKVMGVPVMALGAYAVTWLWSDTAEYEFGIGLLERFLCIPVILAGLLAISVALYVPGHFLSLLLSDGDEDATKDSPADEAFDRRINWMEKFVSQLAGEGADSVDDRKRS